MKTCWVRTVSYGIHELLTTYLLTCLGTLVDLQVLRTAQGATLNLTGRSWVFPSFSGTGPNTL